MRVKIFFSTLLLLMVNVALLYAQDPGEPCGGNDVDNNGCPLDTWVILLAFVAIVIAAWHLNNKRKAAPVIPQSF
jgi:hypothetical protein